MRCMIAALISISIPIYQLRWRLRHASPAQSDRNQWTWTSTGTQGDWQPVLCHRQWRASPAEHVTGDAAASGAGGHVGGEDVVGMPVEVLAGPVVAGGRAGISVPRGDLDIAQVYPGI